MGINALGYVGLVSARSDEWAGLATGLFGMQQVDRGGGTRAYRMDDRKQRLVVKEADHDGLDYIGWEVGSSSELTQLADKLDRSGVAVREGEPGLTAERWVERLIIFRDPAGNRLEAFTGPVVNTDSFLPGRPIVGFRTGGLGMGHVVLDVADIDSLLPFYRDVLGFHVSDYGLSPYKLYFFHVNGRHHSFAMVENGNRRIHHIMMEVQHLDDVGQGYDLAGLEGGRLAYTLGRHTNDHVTSFYSHTPSGFFVEYGWGGRVIDPASWVPHETFDGPSLWGHDRLYMAEGPRKRLRDMRLGAAAKGLRAPVAPDCLWLDSVIGRE